MRLPGRRRLLAGSRWLRSRFRARVLVLGYHRLGEPPSDPFGLYVTEERFRAHVEIVRRRARLLALGDVVDGLGAGALAGGSAAITFDDAHGPTLTELRRIAAEIELPITMFVPSGLMDREPWWDRLHRRLAGAAELPARLEVDVEGAGMSRDLGSDERRAGTPARRDRLVIEVYDALRRLRAEVREAVLVEVERWAGPIVDTRFAEPERVAAAAEVARAADEPFVALGSHSVSHPFLADAPPEEQRREIEESRSALEEVTGKRVDWFSYPNGSTGPVTRRLVREAGYEAAFASRPDVVTLASDRFDLPRFWPEEADDSVARTIWTWLTWSRGGRPAP